MCDTPSHTCPLGMHTPKPHIPLQPCTLPRHTCPLAMHAPQGMHVHALWSCTPPPRYAIPPGTHAPPGMHAPAGTHTPTPSHTPWACMPPSTHTPLGTHAPGYARPQPRTPPVHRIKDACENITLPQLRCG